MPGQLPHGVMLNAYPDSIGARLADTVTLLRRPELADAFSLFYILPTFFNSDLDRGFSVIDYDLNRELVDPADLDALDELGITLKADLVLNHLSVGSPQFVDMVTNGDDSPYRDFFIDWNEFWAGNGTLHPDGHIVPDQEHLDRLFMRKPGLPILRIRFPDGTDRFYWNTFYQSVTHRPLASDALDAITALSAADRETIRADINAAIERGDDPTDLEFGASSDEVRAVVELHREYLGQMDLNADSEAVWEFYDETLARLAGFGVRILRLDAFAYLHKRVGMSNFFNRPGTWEYLDRLAEIAETHGLTLLPEIHSQYGTAIHTELAEQGHPIYDFFFPGLVIDALDRGDQTHLVRWISEVLERSLSTVTMLGCHDGIPVIDLRGGVTAEGDSRPGLLDDDAIEAIITRLLERGGRVKNLYGPDGTKISYYQVNATFFSALGEDEARLVLARAIHMFMPGIPQVWYLDLFAGTNDYEAADRAGEGGHKEINRTNLSLATIEQRLASEVVSRQLELIVLRNTHAAFRGSLTVEATEPHRLVMRWTNGDAHATLDADLAAATFTVTCVDSDQETTITS